MCIFEIFEINKALGANSSIFKEPLMHLRNAVSFLIAGFMDCCGLWFICMFFSLGLFAQDYRSDNWEVKDGLPQNSVNQILQTTDGYIWVATEGGLARFDGVSFTNFSVENAPELKGNRISILFENANGDLLISSYGGGLILYRDNHFYDLSDSLGYGDGTYVHIRNLPDNKLYFFSSAGMRIVAEAQTYKIIEKNPEYEMPWQPSSFFTNVALVSRSAESANFHSEKYVGPGRELVPVHNQFGSIIFVNDYDEFWVMDGPLIAHYRDWRLVDRFDVSPYFEESAQIELSLFGTNLYIRKYSSPELVLFNMDKKEFTELTTDYVCPEGLVNQVFEDREGNVWFATSICGLVKLKPPRFKHIAGKNQEIITNIYPVTFDHKDRLIMGSREHGVFIINDDGLVEPGPDNLPVHQYFVQSITRRDNTTFLSYVWFDHILKWEGDEVSKIPFPEGQRIPAKALYTTRDNRVLIGTERNLLELVNDTMVVHPLAVSMPIEEVSGFLEDSRDNLWIVTDRKVIAYHESRREVVFNSETYTKERRYYRGLYEDSQGVIYAGSYGFGLMVILTDTMYQITIRQGLNENVVSTITEDSKGNLWLTGNKGLSRLRKSELQEVISGNREKLNAVLFNEETDALRSGEFNGGIQQSKLWLGEEKYIFPTLKGAVMVDFADMKENQLPPPVRIEKFVIHDSTYYKNGQLSFEYSEDRLDIYFTALSFVSPNNVRFKFMLEGYDNEWIEAGPERKTTYSKIPPGDYTFRVIACNDEGIWNNEGDEAQIIIIPLFYMTWWFRVLLVFLLLFLTGLVVYKITVFNQKLERDKSALMDILPDLVFKTDQDGNYLDMYGNPGAMIVPVGKMRGKRMYDFLPAAISDQALIHIRKAIEAMEMQQYDFELKIEGEMRNFDSRFIAIDRSEVLCIIRDITDSTMAQQQIREGELLLLEALETEKKLLSRITTQQKMQLDAIVNTEENERRRIAKDLHDGIGQLLSSVKINLGVAREKISQSDLVTSLSLVDKSKTSIDEITRELRNISYNLLPPSLEQFGLASAIEEEVNKLKNNPHLFIHFDNSTTDVKFDAKVEIVLYRVFQELLNNALKHAIATEITIQFIQHTQALVLMIEDNGRGFNIDEGILKKDSSGLKNLYSRIELIHGRINVDSTPSSGTSITIEIPI